MPDGAVGLTVDDVARLAGGRLVRDESPAAGTRDVAVARRFQRVATLADAGPDAVAFYADRRYADAFAATGAGAVLVSAELVDAPGATTAARVVVERPHEAMLAVVAALYPTPVRAARVDDTARVGVGARLGAGVRIDAYATIGAGATLGDGAWVGPHCDVGEGASIGAGTELRAHVTLYPRTVIGARVVVHGGARLGADGFGYVFRDGAHQKVPHVGRCVVEDDVEIGANTTIDRGSVGDTVIGAGTKIDNLVHVGHNVRIGKRCLLMAQVGLAGSATIEDGVVIAGQAGVGGHVTIGRGARIGGQAGVFGDVPPGATWSGYPARPHKESMRAHAALFRLAALVRPIERLLATGGART